MANRRLFLEQSLKSCGAVAFVGRTKAFTLWLTAAAPTLLPEGWEFYEVGGQILFSVYGANGGLTSRQICWLIQRSGKQWYSIPVEFTHADMDVLETPCHQWTKKITDAIKTFKPVPVNLDGGALPMPEDFNG